MITVVGGGSAKEDKEAAQKGELTQRRRARVCSIEVIISPCTYSVLCGGVEEQARQLSCVTLVDVDALRLQLALSECPWCALQ